MWGNNNIKELYFAWPYKFIQYCKSYFKNQNYIIEQLRYFGNNLSRTSKQAEIHFVNCMLIKQWRIQGRGPGGLRPAPPPPLFLDQTEARRAEIIFFETTLPVYSRTKIWPASTWKKLAGFFNATHLQSGHACALTPPPPAASPNPGTPGTPIGHFQVPPGLCFKTKVGVQPLKWKSFFILMQITLVFTRMVVHLASFWKWEFLELGSGLFENHDGDARRLA